MPHKWVFLDRDGVVNRDSDAYVKRWEEFAFLPRSLDALRLLAEHGLPVVVVTNQSAIGRGLTPESEVARIHTRMTAAVEKVGGRIRAVYYCPHAQRDGCRCRKPRPGMVEQACRELALPALGGGAGGGQRKGHRLRPGSRVRGRRAGAHRQRPVRGKRTGRKRDAARPGCGGPFRRGPVDREGSMKKRKPAPRFLTALGANRAGEIFEIEGYAAVGMAGPVLVPLTTANTVAMPHGGELMYLPDRRPVVFDPEAGRLETLDENPFAPGEPIFPVAAFNSPGWVLAQVSAYRGKTRCESSAHVCLRGRGVARPGLPDAAHQRGPRTAPGPAADAARGGGRRGARACAGSCRTTGSGPTWRTAPSTSGARPARTSFWAGTRPPCPHR